MIKPGLLMWIFKDKNVFYIRILNLFGFGWEFIDKNNPEYARNWFPEYAKK